MNKINNIVFTLDNKPSEVDLMIYDVIINQNLWNEKILTTTIDFVNEYQNSRDVHYTIKFRNTKPHITDELTSFQYNRVNGMRGRTEQLTMQAIQDEELYRRRNKIKRLLDLKKHLFDYKSKLHDLIEYKYKSYGVPKNTKSLVSFDDCLNYIKEELKSLDYKSGEEFDWKDPFMTGHWLPMKP